MSEKNHYTRHEELSKRIETAVGFNLIVFLLLGDFYTQLKKLNERQGKEDAGNND